MARNQIGRPKNYPILSNDAYREGWERIWATKAKRDNREAVKPRDSQHKGQEG